MVCIQLVACPINVWDTAGTPWDTSGESATGQLRKYRSMNTQIRIDQLFSRWFVSHLLILQEADKAVYVHIINRDIKLLL